MSVKNISIKKHISKVLHLYGKHYIPNIIFTWFIILLIIIDVFTTILETLSLPAQVLNFFKVLEIVILVIFSIEYILRLWTADLLHPERKPFVARLKYAFSFYLIIDFMAIASFYLSFIFPININILRIFRILRILKLLRAKHYSVDIHHVGTVLGRKASQLIVSILIIFIMMIISSMLLYTVENNAQPDVFGDAVSGLWWAITTMSTIGFGDIYPVTPLGKVINSIFSLLNIGLLAIPTGIISSGFIENRHESRSYKHIKKHFCPHCGKNLDS
jgi:voltage-gated potassium channel